MGRTASPSYIDELVEDAIEHARRIGDRAVDAAGRV
jgi:hypothetical protein